MRAEELATELVIYMDEQYGDNRDLRIVYLEGIVRAVRGLLDDEESRP